MSIIQSKNLKGLQTPTLIFLRRKSQSAAEYCLNTVRKYDYENFVCTLLLKNSARACAFAVRAFNVEIGRIAEQVSTPSTGLMRIKFWEDALNGCYSNSTIPQHPVVIELYKAITTGKLTKRYLTTLIKCRKENFTSVAFTNIEALEKHAEESVSNIYYLILEGNNVRNVNADHAASHLGKAQGIIQQLRAVAVAKHLNIVTLPQDIMVKNNLSHEEILRGISSERLNNCSFEIASRAYQHLTKARSLLPHVPVEGRSSLLPAVIVENYLKRLQKAHHNVLHPSLRHRNWIWLPKLWLKRFKQEF